SSRRRHTRSTRDWSSDVCSSDLYPGADAKLGASRAICAYPADKTVARRKRRLLLHRISAAAHIDVRARKARKLHLHLHLVSRWRSDLFLNDCDLRLVTEPGDQSLLNHCHSLVDTTQVH